MNKKIFLLGAGTIATIIAPVSIVVSCKSGKEQQELKQELKVIKMNFAGNDAEKLLAINDFKNDIYEAKINPTDYVKYEIDLNLPINNGDYKINLSSTEFADVQNGKISENGNDLSFDDFISNMNSVTGTFHQYHYAKDDAVKLGVDTAAKSMLNPFGEDKHDPKFQEQWLMDNLIKILPSDVQIEKIEAHKATNNIIVTFTDKNKIQHKDVDFHLTSSKTQSEADAENAKGGTWFYKAFKAVETPIQKIVGEIKTLAHYGGVNNSYTEKDFFTNVAKTIADFFVDKLSIAIPVYGQIAEMPIIGEKVTGFVHTHVVDPIVQKIADKI